MVLNAYGRKGIRLTQTQRRALKLTPKNIIQNNVKNLNLRYLPSSFIQEDLLLLTDDFEEVRLVINIPYNRTEDKFHDYAFVLLNDSRQAANLCKKWNEKVLVDTLGSARRVKFHKANHSPREFLKRILRSKCVFDQDPKKRPKFFLENERKANSLLQILELSHDQFVDQFNYLRVNSDFDIFFNKSSLFLL